MAHTTIWNAAAVTAAATDRIPVDVSSSGAPSRWTGQDVANAPGRIGVTVNALGSINSNTTIDLTSGHYVTATIAGALTFTFSNPPATGQGTQFVLVLTDGGSATITWPVSVTWAGATAPTLRSSGTDLLRFYTQDGGTSWFGELASDELGITGFTASQSTSSPNATVYVSQLLASGSASSIAVALTPKGTSGYLTAHEPDSGTGGGNIRGAGAVDWQQSRSLATRVASGTNSTIIGGTENTASGTNAIAGGTANTASNTSATALGANNTASGQNSTAIGQSNTASGTGSTAFGFSNTASGGYSWCPGGYQATTRGLNGAWAYAYGQRSALGDAQVFGMVQRVVTTATSAATLTAGGAAVSATNVAVLPNNSSHGFRAFVTARNATNVGSGSWEICGTIARGANAASTALVGTTTIRAFGISASLGAPTVDVVADTTQGAPVIQVTPANTDSTYWVGKIEMNQVA